MAGWVTVVVEMWKRKNSEVSTRWGVLNIMKKSVKKQENIRPSFIGGEEIHKVTGELTKFHSEYKKNLITLLSIPVLAILLALYVAAFWYT